MSLESGPGPWWTPIVPGHAIIYFLGPDTVPSSLSLPLGHRPHRAWASTCTLLGSELDHTPWSELSYPGAEASVGRSTGGSPALLGVCLTWSASLAMVTALLRPGNYPGWGVLIAAHHPVLSTPSSQHLPSPRAYSLYPIFTSDTVNAAHLRPCLPLVSLSISSMALWPAVSGFVLGGETEVEVFSR